MEGSYAAPNHSDGDLYISRPTAKSSRNHKENVKHIIPTDLKIALIIGALLAATVITFACLTGNGTLSVPDWAAKTLEGVAYGIGSLQLLSLPFLIGYYFRTKQQLEHWERMRDASSETSQTDPPIPAITQEEWDHRLSNEPKQPYSFINLDQPGQSCPLSGIGSPQLPLFGTYTRGGDSFTYLHDMSVRLPSSQLRAFPKELQRQFAKEGLSNKAECYFIVVNNTEKKQSEVRTMPLHPIIFADYAKTEPTHLSQAAKDHGVKIFHSSGIQVPVSMAMYGKGVQKTHDKFAIPIDEDPKTFNLQVHGDPNQTPAISPQHAEFRIPEGPEGPAVSSAYLGATWGEGEHKRGIAIHAIFLNNTDIDMKHGKILENALKTPHIDAFLQSLQENEFNLRDDVKRTFTLPMA